MGTGFHYTSLLSRRIRFLRFLLPSKRNVGKNKNTSVSLRANGKDSLALGRWGPHGVCSHRVH